MKIDKLKRLVRVTQLLYRQEAAEVARLQGERTDLLQSMDVAVQRLDADATFSFEAGIALPWAGRPRRETARAYTKLESQLSAAGSALASLKGAESRLSSERGKLEKEAESKELEQVIENVVRRGSRLGQAEIANIDDEPELLALPSPRGEV